MIAWTNPIRNPINILSPVLKKFFLVIIITFSDEILLPSISFKIIDLEFLDNFFALPATALIGQASRATSDTNKLLDTMMGCVHEDENSSIMVFRINIAWAFRMENLYILIITAILHPGIAVPFLMAVATICRISTCCLMTVWLQIAIRIPMHRLHQKKRHHSTPSPWVHSPQANPKRELWLRPRILLAKKVIRHNPSQPAGAR